MNVTSRSRFYPSWFVPTTGLLLLLLALAPCTAQDQETAAAAAPPPEPEDEKKNGAMNNQKKGKSTFFLAESMDMPPSSSSSSSSIANPTMAVLSNTLWAFDAAQHAPTTIIGTARGTCWKVLLDAKEEADSTNIAWDCQWTLTVNDGKSSDTGTTSSKIMLQGDYYSATTADKDDEEETMIAIVGGTGEYNGASGSVTVLQTKEMLRIYSVNLV